MKLTVPVKIRVREQMIQNMCQEWFMCKPDDAQAALLHQISPDAGYGVDSLSRHSEDSQVVRSVVEAQA